MNIIDFYLLEQKRLHQWMRASVSDLTGQVCISHCFIHFGEIAYILGELGKQGLPF